MAFNFNYFKGTTSSQAQQALYYWMNALTPVEDVDRMKAEKENAIVENANQLQEVLEGDVPEPANLHELSERQSSIEWEQRG